MVIVIVMVTIVMTTGRTRNDDVGSDEKQNDGGSGDAGNAIHSAGAGVDCGPMCKLTS